MISPLRRLRRPAGRVALILILPLAGCGLLEPSDRRPNEADIIVEGTSEVPLRVVLSTNFTAQPNPETGQMDVFILTSESHDLPLPINLRMALTTDRILVRVVNLSEDETADVRMRVFFDGSGAYDQQATLLDARLEFIHIFH